MINKENNFFTQNKEVILYLVFGVTTTVISWIIYKVCYKNLHLINIPSNLINTASNIISWIIAVLFAFFTNKIWVFDSKSFESKVVLHELATFVGGRIVTLVIDVLIMAIAVDILKIKGPFLKFDILNLVIEVSKEDICKVISCVIVVIVNYILSKLFVFKTKT